MTSQTTDPDLGLLLTTDVIPGRIGVVTVLYNSASVLPDFFKSIESQTYTNFTVFAVDNASADNSITLCRERNSQRGDLYQLIPNDKNLGVAAGNNQGIRAAIAAGCEYILLLNNDVVFGPELFTELLAGIARNHCDMVTTLSYYFEPPNMIWGAGGSFQRWAGNRLLHHGDGEIDHGQFNQERQVDCAPTCCVLIRREVFARIGLMDEAYFVYWDDTDFMLRAHRAGVRLFFLPSAKLWHKVSSLTGSNSDFSVAYSTRNHAYYYKKHLPALAVVLLSALYYSVYALQYLTGMGGGRRRARLRLKSWTKGLKMAT
jgi:GT2 family glycosyltransferase